MGLTRTSANLSPACVTSDVPADAIADGLPRLHRLRRRHACRTCREPVRGSWRKSVNYPRPGRPRSRISASRRLPAPDLALIYGTAAHALDYDDTGLNGHPSAVLVPAILAEAQEVGADGKAMIAAYVAGYEIWAEFVAREPDSLHQKGLASLRDVRHASPPPAHPRCCAGSTPSTRRAPSALRRRSPRGVVANFGSMTKPFHLGRTAQSGARPRRGSRRPA